MKILLAGATGFIGRALRKKLCSAGHEVTVLIRKKCPEATGAETLVVWNGESPGDWMTRLDGVDVVINLAGENIAAKFWTAARKQAILSSRVDATRAIVNAIAHAKKKPTVLINASAVGYYGDVPEGELTEASGAGHGFLAATCEQWEAEARKAELSGTRVVLARLGPVIGERGGILSKMLPPFRLFMGAPLGTGRQWISWVHLDDVIGACLFMIGHGDLSGAVNVTAPNAVTMREFSSTLAKTLRRPCWPPVPGFFLKLAMGEMAMLVLSGQKVAPEKLLRAGYRFRHESLASALKTILSN